MFDPKHRQINRSIKLISNQKNTFLEISRIMQKRAETQIAKKIYEFFFKSSILKISMQSLSETSLKS